MRILRFLVVLMLLPAWTVAQPLGQSFGYELIKNPVGNLVLRFRVEAAAKGLYLGVSLYPPNVTNTLAQGRHFAFPVKDGVFIKEFDVDPSFEKGSFEAALWTGRTEKADCAASDSTCQKLGYRLTGMVGYVWGYLTAR